MIFHFDPVSIFVDTISIFQYVRREKMAIFLVDLEFREKAKQYLTSKEIFFVIMFLFFALIPWVDIFNFAYNGVGGNATKFWQEFNEVHCNPKFAKLCPQA